jgi:hypothetical protein
MCPDLAPQAIENPALLVYLNHEVSDLEIGSAMAILEAGRKKAKEIPLDAYMQVILNANADVFFGGRKDEEREFNL